MRKNSRGDAPGQIGVLDQAFSVRAQ